jgi:hypothetical protein
MLVGRRKPASLSDSNKPDALGAMGALLSYVVPCEGSGGADVKSGTEGDMNGHAGDEVAEETEPDVTGAMAPADLDFVTLGMFIIGKSPEPKKAQRAEKAKSPKLAQKGSAHLQEGMKRPAHHDDMC